MVLERVQKLEILIFKESFKDCRSKVSSGSLTWSRGGEYWAGIGYTLFKDPLPTRVLLKYTLNQTQDLEYFVNFENTHCRYGGYRTWFICPKCGCRCIKLYLKTYFVCRSCTGYLYQLQVDSKKWRMFTYYHKGKKADELDQTLRKRSYRGVETPKYRRAKKLRMQGLTGLIQVNSHLNALSDKLKNR